VRNSFFEIKNPATEGYNIGEGGEMKRLVMVMIVMVIGALGANGCAIAQPKKGLGVSRPIVVETKIDDAEFIPEFRVFLFRNFKFRINGKAARCFSRKETEEKITLEFWHVPEDWN